MPNRDHNLDALTLGSTDNTPLIDGASFWALPFVVCACHDCDVHRASAYKSRDDDNYTKEIGVARARLSSGNGVIADVRTAEPTVISRERTGW